MDSESRSIANEFTPTKAVWLTWLLREYFRFAQSLAQLVLAGQRGRALERPFDADLGIVPGDATLAFRGVEGGGLVEELGGFAQGDEAVGESRRNPELVLVAGREYFAAPRAEGWL